MNLKKVFFIWFVVSLACLVEYWALKHNQKFSVLIFLQTNFHFFKGKSLTTGVGQTVSYALGWIGFGLLILTNPYIFRKRYAIFGRWGQLSNWLSFHILCGLLGPTFVILHSDFKVGGLVAISFWSMMIVAISGVVGSYFYLQVSAQKSELLKEVEHWDMKLRQMRDKYAKEILDESLDKIKKKALIYVGADIAPEQMGFIALPWIFIKSFICDIKLYFAEPKTLVGLPPKSRLILGNYGLANRKIILLEPFQRMLGHWHTFHVPFAVLMFVAAVIHVIAVLLLGI